MGKFVVDIEERPQLIKKDGCYGCVMSVAYTFTVQSSETHLLPAGELYISPRRIGFINDPLLRCELHTHQWCSQRNDVPHTEC